MMTNHSVVRAPTQYVSVTASKDEVIRELMVRKRCYDKWVAEGKLTATEAESRWTAICSAVAHLERLEALDRASGTTPAGAPENVTGLQFPAGDVPNVAAN